jgi:hypothetical protein
LDGAKNKKPGWSKKQKAKLGLNSKFGTKPQLGFFFYSIQVFFCTEKSSNGAKKKKVELGHDFEFGTNPNLAFFCSIRASLCGNTLREAQMEQKEKKPN